MNRTLKNREQIVCELTEILKDFSKTTSKVQTDVYLYVDVSGNGRLDTFVNVGGNSWLDDDHYNIYQDKPHDDPYDGFYEYTDIDEFAYICNISRDTLMCVTAEYLQIDNDDIDTITNSDVYRYLTSSAADFKFVNALIVEYYDSIDDHTQFFYNQAGHIISRWEAYEI